MGDIVLYLLFLSSAFLHFSGYVLMLGVISVLRPRRLTAGARSVSDPDLPSVTIVVPVYNEKDYIEAKIANLLELEYPADRKKIVIVDGGSTDGTADLVKSAIQANPGMAIQLLQAGRSGKIHQLNSALDGIDAKELVVVTDADSLIAPREALLKTVFYLKENRNVGLLGGWTRPPEHSEEPTVAAEYAYWDKQNRLRYMETVSFSASIVVAPYYAFYRDLFDRFPSDCVADDVYISFRAHLSGKRVVYVPDIDIIECRQPSNLEETARHKLRKANAYTTELLRALYLLPVMQNRFKFFYVIKVFQFFYLPWALLGLLLWTPKLFFSGQAALVIASMVVFGGSLVLTSISMVPPPNRTRGGFTPRAITSSAVLFVLMWFILLFNFFLYPFWKQNSCYPKVNGEGASS